MPYFVFAIHTDNTDNRLYGQYENFVEADKEERDMRDGNVHGDNYFVRMFFAKSLEEAETKADGLRPHPKKTKA
jgi:hypothetical protein